MKNEQVFTLIFHCHLPCRLSSSFAIVSKKKRKTAPGDIADTIAATMGGADEKDMIQLRAEYGLDQPFFIQLFQYIIKIATLDLGNSQFYNMPVFDLIMERLPATLLLVFSAQIVSLGLGILLGVYAAQNPNGLSSLFVNMLSLFGYAAPVFWTGILLLIAFSLYIPGAAHGRRWRDLSAAWWDSRRVE